MKNPRTSTRRAVASAVAALGAAALPAAALGAAALPATAAAAVKPAQTPAGVVFVQTDGLTGNEIVAYARAPGGALTEAGSYPTEGLGGQLSGSVVDHTASQGALAYDSSQNLLLAVNAGSNSISAFRVEGDTLTLRQVVSSGGKFPVSVTTHANQAYVLNAEEGGSLQGYDVSDGSLTPLANQHRALGLTTGKQGEASQFTHTPGQVALSPNDKKLIVTTKQAGESVDVFAVNPTELGQHTRLPTVNAEGTSNPFDVVFGPAEEVILAEAGPNALASFQLQPSGKLVALGEAATGQAATCWVTSAGGYVYASNAGSASVTRFATGPHGQLSDLGNTPTHGGTVDSAAVGDLLYVQGGAEGTIDEFQIQPGGGLASLGSVTVPGAIGAEGIVAL